MVFPRCSPREQVGGITSVGHNLKKILLEITKPPALAISGRAPGDANATLVLSQYSSIVMQLAFHDPPNYTDV